MSDTMIMDLPLTETPFIRKERVLDAALLHFDLSACIEKMKNEIAWKTGNRDMLTLFRNPSMKIELIALHTGAKITPHKSEGVLSLQMLEGVIKFRIENETIVLNKGELLTLHKNILYEIRAMEEAFFTLTIALDRFDR